MQADLEKATGVETLGMGSSAFSDQERFAFCLLDDGRQSRSDSRDFWNAIGVKVGDEKMDTEEALKGFLDGAEEVWDAVKDKL